MTRTDGLYTGVGRDGGIYIGGGGNGSIQDEYRNVDLTGVEDIVFADGWKADGKMFFNTPACMHAFLNNKTLEASTIEVYSNIGLPNRKVVNAAGMFDGCSNLPHFPKFYGSMASWKFTQAMFKNCSSVTGRFDMGGHFKPIWCQQMFMGCSAWDGSGTNSLDFSATTHETSMSLICKGVTLSELWTEQLLESILRTTPEGAHRKNVHIGGGLVNSQCMALVKRCQDCDIEIVYDGHAEDWDEAFVSFVNGFHHESIDPSTLDLSGQFVTGYNGGLITPTWGIFAKHYTPPVGHVVRTQKGEEFRVTSERHPHPSMDLVLCKLDRRASSTAPMLVWNKKKIHRYLLGGTNMVKFLEHPCFTIFALDRNEQPWIGDLQYFKASGDAIAGPCLEHDGHGFSVGDSGSVQFVVDADGHVFNFGVVSVASGSGASFAHHVDWIEQVTGERVRLS